VLPFYVELLLFCLLMRLFKPELYLDKVGKLWYRVVVACPDTALTVMHLVFKSMWFG